MEETNDLIDAVLKGVGKFNMEEINKLIDAALEAEEGEERSYLGASQLGMECERALQYSYLKVPRDKPFAANVLKAFEAGHVFEKLCKGWLIKAGFEFKEGESKFSLMNGALQGHFDGVITKVPEDLEILTPCLWEAKSLNAATWGSLQKKGLQVANPIYYAQVALYQAYGDLHKNPALFTAINKNTGELYHELIEFDAPEAQKASDRFVRVYEACKYGIDAQKKYHSKTFYKCKLCPWQNTCWSE